jgi:hypothetical protein
VAEDFGEAHVRDIFGADDALLAGGLHGGAAEAGEGGGGYAGAEFGDDLGAVVVAGGFAGGEEDARIGDGGDGDKFSLSSPLSLLRVVAQLLHAPLLRVRRPVVKNCHQ